MAIKDSHKQKKINQHITSLVNFSYSFIESNDNVIFQLWKLLIINIILFCCTQVHTLNVIIGLLMPESDMQLHSTLHKKAFYLLHEIRLTVRLSICRNVCFTILKPCTFPTISRYWLLLWPQYIWTVYGM